ncbi:hypothetical protein [Algibacillus agarilyticus]|uniref:hypothetical protein n=1 Tax=Algibacillus agarilyticus TaxID=2234133 RepID=UPI000DD01EB1|nr:hypothetical protein [Algibacillus agarilyticus]
MEFREAHNEKKLTIENARQKRSSFPFRIMPYSFNLKYSKELAFKNNVPAAYDKIQIHNNEDKAELITTSIVPSVQIDTNLGILTGDNRGEWGGELLLIDQDGNIEFILDLKVHDIYQVSNGYLIVGTTLFESGLYLLKLNSPANYQIKKVFGLLSSPRRVSKLANGDLLINTDLGLQLYTKQGYLKNVACELES